MASRGRQLVQLALQKQQEKSDCKDLNNNYDKAYRIQGSSIVDVHQVLACKEQLSSESSDNESKTEASKSNDNKSSTEGCQVVGNETTDQMRGNIGSVLASAIMVVEGGDKNNINEKDHHAPAKSDYEVMKQDFEEPSTSKSPGDTKTHGRSHTCTHGDEQYSDDMSDGEELDLDDSGRDPDYFPAKQDNGYESSDEPETFPTEVNEVIVDHEEVVEDAPNVKRRKKRSEDEWERKKQKLARMKGKSYKGLKKSQEGRWLLTEDRKERVLKPRGCSKKCESSTIKCCGQISELDRKTLFHQFWTRYDWNEKKLYVSTSVLECECKTKSVESSGRKGKSYRYYLTVGEQRICVCKKMFLNTLGIGEKALYGWKHTKVDDFPANMQDNQERQSQESQSQESQERQSQESQSQESPRGATGSSEASEANTRAKGRRHVKPRISNERQKARQNVKDYLEKLPKMESHYCRSTSKKLYIEPVFTTKAELYRAYVDSCKETGQAAASNCLFYQVFDEMNLSLYTPKKDQCDTCCEFECGNITEDVYRKHMQRKEDARRSKADDKEKCLVHKSLKVLTMDLQAVMLCPKLQASALYYKTKLTCHNHTIMDLGSNDVTCYFWTETDGDLSASSFATCITHYIENLLATEPEVKEIVLYSDGCNYQNRNVVLANALLKTAIDKQITIVQKFLERGHTQMEVDAMHSLIERRLKKRPIYVPQTYVDIISSARPKQEFTVHYVSYSFFKDMTELSYYKSIRPGIKVGDPTVTDIRVLRYSSSGTIDFKLGYQDEYQDLPRRARQHTGTGAITPLHQSRLPIKESKYKHLQELKRVMPQDYHPFYDRLNFR